MVASHRPDRRERKKQDHESADSRYDPARQQTKSGRCPRRCTGRTIPVVNQRNLPTDLRGMALVRVPVARLPSHAKSAEVAIAAMMAVERAGAQDSARATINPQAIGAAVAARIDDGHTWAHANR